MQDLEVFFRELGDLITILGPTASGKTTFATRLAERLDAEIISADSRQVYRRMTLGTGKDLADYIVNGKQIPAHLIDICEPGEKYNVFQFQHDFHRAFADIKNRGKMPVLCGGTGLYIESVLKGYKLLDVPENPGLRESLQGKSLDELAEILKSYKKLHNKTEVDSCQRAIRAIEIEEYYLRQEPDKRDYEPVNSLIIGLDIDRELRREKISRRLKTRLDEGMLDEVKSLLSSGISPEDLIYYGLEYKYLTLHLIGKLSYQEMYNQLEIAIHQFAKRQMTWFRGMERRGFKIQWLNASSPLPDRNLLSCFSYSRGDFKSPLE
jgi:tRNA dimethylallyltransferase